MTLVKESLLELKREVIFLLEIYFFTGNIIFTGVVMKKKVVMMLIACMLVGGCGIDTTLDTKGEADDAAVEESKEENDDASSEESVEDDSDESSSKSDDETDVASEASTQEEEEAEIEEASDMELFNRFLGVEGDSLEAVSDVDIVAVDYNDVQFFDFKKGDEFSVSDIKEGISKSGWGDDMIADYTFFYEDTDSPVLVIRVPNNPNYSDENNLLMFFKVQDGEVHLVNYKDTMCVEYTSNYVGSNGLVSYNAYPLGMSSSGIMLNDTYIVDEDAQMILIYEETMYSVSEAEYVSDINEAFELFTKTYGEDSWSYISQAMCDGEIYFVLYSDESDTDLDKEFKDACEKKGIKIYTREEVMEVVNDHIADLGFDADISKLDDNQAEWEEL